MARRSLGGTLQPAERSGAPGAMPLQMLTGTAACRTTALLCQYLRLPLKFNRHLQRSSAVSALASNWGSKKVRQKRLQSFRNNMDPKLEEVLAPLRISVKEQVMSPYGEVSKSSLRLIEDL